MPAFVRGVMPEGVAVGSFVGFADLDAFETGGGVEELLVLRLAFGVFGAPDDVPAGGAGNSSWASMFEYSPTISSFRTCSVW